LLLKAFQKKIRDRKARIGVVGLGYVGLPLAVAFAKKGLHVTGIDVDPKKVSLLNRGGSYILDVPAADIKAVLRARRFHAAADYKNTGSLDAIIICVPTPLSKTNEPDISYVIDATKEIARHLKKGQLIVLESTTYPGTTEEVMMPLLEKAGLKTEKEFFLAFSPERVDPGNKDFGITSIPKVVGGVGKYSTEAVRVLYASIMNQVVPVSSAKTAEMVKLLENTFRSVNIGLINEIAMMSNRLGVDIWEVIRAAKTKPFGFMPFYPGPGIGGHCLPIDPLYLSWKSRLHGFEAKMIELAATINKNMPFYVVERVMHLLNQQEKTLKKAPILVMGVSYKKDIDDVRESPALEVVEHLLEEGAAVSYTDPYVPSLKVKKHAFRSVPLTPALLKRQACVVILTDHARFDYDMVIKNAKLVLDTRNVLRRFQSKPNIYFL
jgi:UDP-N-acetyl-D-glucosamine dehydrogenase